MTLKCGLIDVNVNRLFYRRIIEDINRTGDIVLYDEFRMLISETALKNIRSDQHYLVISNRLLLAIYNIARLNLNYCCNYKLKGFVLYD